MTSHTIQQFISWRERIKFDKFLEYEAMVENLTGEKIKVLRTDNGGEYLSKTFSDHLKRKADQTRTDSTRNTPAERSSKTCKPYHSRNC